MRYGAINAPGVSLELEQTPKAPQPGAVGTTVLFGAFERGPVGVPTAAPVQTNSLTSLQRRRGGYLEGHYAPDAARHFLEAARGTGTLFTVRVTDGNEIESALSLYGRKPPRGVRFHYGDAALNPVVLSLAAKWGGRAGGKRGVIGGLLSGAGDVTATTVVTGRAMLKDQYKGGTLHLMGVSARTYTITGNTTAGVLSVAADLDMAADLAAGDVRNLYWSAELENLEADGTRKAIGVEIVPRGQRRGASDFGLRCYLDRSRVWDLADLAMVLAAGRTEVAAALAGKVDNYEIDGLSGWAGSDDPAARPANWAGIAADGGVATNTLTLQIVEWKQTTGGTTTKGYVHAFVHGSDVREDTIVLHFTGALAYTVSSTLVNGIPAAVALGANALHNLHPYLTGFTVVAGTDPFANGDEITIRIKPLPVDGSLKGALLYPDADGANAAVAIPVLSNTYNTVTVPASYDLTTYATDADWPGIETIDAGPWDCDPALEITGITVDGRAVADFSTGVDGSLKPDELVAAWEAHSPLLKGEVLASGKAKLGSRSTGSTATFAYTAGSAGGVIVAAGPQSATGVNGSLVVLQYVQEFGGGYDGDLSTLAAGHMVSALAPAGSIKHLVPKNTGLIQFGCPGWTDPSVIEAGRTLSEAILGLFVPDFPQAQVTEESARALVEATWGTSDGYAPYWPSWGYCNRSETGEADVLTPLTGKILGLQAYSWSTYGMGKAPAGDYLPIAGVNRFLKNSPEIPADAEILNQAGIRTLTPYGTLLPLLWGDRIPGDTETWLHKTALLRQIARELLNPATFRRFIFALNDSLTWADVRAAARQLLEQHYRAGWFRRDLPKGFEDAVQIRIDSETTPEETRAAGEAVLTVGVVPPDTIERLTVKLSKAGVEI